MRWKHGTMNVQGMIAGKIESCAAETKNPNAVCWMFFVFHNFQKVQKNSLARYVRIVTHGCKGYVFDSFSWLTEIPVFSARPSKDIGMATKGPLN